MLTMHYLPLYTQHDHDDELLNVYSYVYVLEQKREKTEANTNNLIKTGILENLNY